VRWNNRTWIIADATRTLKSAHHVTQCVAIDIDGTAITKVMEHAMSIARS
jgi:hypothetical protein